MIPTSIKTWKKLLLFCTLLIGAGGFQEALASHFGAGDLSVTYIGSGANNLKYKVRLYTYVACEPGQASLYTSEIIGWTSSCNPGGSRSISITLNQWGTQGGDTLDQLCPGFTGINSCRSGNLAYPGFVRGTFEDTVTLPVACSDWTFSWTDGSRNGAILNIGQGASSGYSIYLEARLDNTGTHWNNSTPRFLVDPIPYICVNQDDKFVNGPYDPDVDSLITTANTSFSTGPTSPIPFTSGYSLANPFGSAINYTGYASPYVVNPTSGTAYFHPTGIGKYVIAYQCKDYDKYTGALIGYCERDIQVSVLACSTTPPTMDSVYNSVIGGTYSISGASGNMITVCPGAALQFQIHADAQVNTATVFVSANNATTAPGSTITTAGQGTAHPITTFNWTPTGADIGPHTILFVGKDSTCNPGQPIVLYNYYIVTINVLPGIDAGPDGHFCPNGSVNSLPWQINVTGPPGINYVWSALPGGSGLSSLSAVTGSPVYATPLSSTTYVVSSNAPQVACKNSDTITVFTHPYTDVKAGADQTICANQSAILSPSITPSTGATWFWTPGVPTLNDSTLYNPYAHPYSTTAYTFHVTDGNGCKYESITNVIINGVAPIVNAFASRDTVCPGGSVDLFSTISQQPCGLAQSQCNGTNATYSVGTDNSPSSLPSPFYYYQYGMGERQQILYTKADLEAAGLTAGYINSLAFNVASKSSNDSFYSFTIKMACTGQQDVNYLSGSSYNVYPNMAVVFSQNIKTTLGWNTFTFPNATRFYWDGQSSIVVELCYSKPYINAYGTDAVYASSTTYSSVLYYQYGNYNTSGCSYTGTYLYTSNQRPNTRFNICTSNGYTYSWSPSGNLTSPTSPNTTANNITSAVSYVITVAATVNPACVGKDTVNLGVDFSNSVDATVNGETNNPYVLCRPGYVQLQAMGQGAPPATNLQCGTANPQACATPDTAVVNASTSAGNSTSFGTNSPFWAYYYATARYQYLVHHKDMGGAGMKSGTIKSIAFFVPTVNFSTTTFYENFTVSLGCTSKNAFNDNQDFITGVTQVFSSASVPIVQGWNTLTFQTPYNWDTTMNLVVQTCYHAPFTSYYYSSQPVSDVPASYKAVVAQYNYSGNVCNGGSGYDNAPINRIPAMRFTYCRAPSAPFAYNWVPGQYVSDSTSSTPTAYIDSSVTYAVHTHGLNGCDVKDEVQIIVPIHHVSASPADTSICAGQSVQFHASGATSYHWYENGFNPTTTLDDPTSANPIATPTQDVSYTVVFSDQYNCNDTSTINLHVWALPIVTIRNADTTIKYGQHVALIATGANFYTWTPVGSLNNPNIPNPVASPTESTTYVLYGDDNHHCRNTDSVRVNVDMRDNLMVPSAFTPNGDGKNDVFRVANLTFQKLMEFRVFNRWGQEIFSTTDVNKGWDGTWKGVAQDMGTYQYIIRVAFPDGFVETYKGDVTLVR